MMTPVQWQAILDAMPVVGAAARGGTKKVNTLESVNGSDWRCWRTHFVTVQAINQWGDERARQEVRAAMMGEAARLTADIPIAGVAVTINTVLDAYQLRFMPAAAGQIARVEFHAAHQRPDETIGQYHGRVREMFQRAYPNVMVENSMQLIQTFALGLLDTEVCRFVLDRDPLTYAVASNLAQTKGATEASLQTRRTGSGRGMHHLGDLEEGQIQTSTNPVDMIATTGGPPKCFYCGSIDHMRPDCPAYKKAQEYFASRGTDNNRTNFPANRGPDNRVRTPAAGRGRPSPRGSGGNREPVRRRVAGRGAGSRGPGGRFTAARARGKLEGEKPRISYLEGEEEQCEDDRRLFEAMYEEASEN